MAAALWRAKVIVGYEATRPDEVTLKVISFVYVNACVRIMCCKIGVTDTPRKLFPMLTCRTNLHETARARTLQTQCIHAVTTHATNTPRCVVVCIIIETDMNW